MRVDLILPSVVPEISSARVEFAHVAQGDMLAKGQKLFDVSIDLSDRFSQECPPISYYRLIAREDACLLRVLIPPGEFCEAGQVIAELGVGVDDTEDEAVARPLRLTTAAILGHEGMWSNHQRR